MQKIDAQLPLASLTKLFTVYSALTELSPNTPITIPADATSSTRHALFLQDKHSRFLTSLVSP